MRLSPRSQLTVVKNHQPSRKYHRTIRFIHCNQLKREITERNKDYDDEH
jgi:hypothetical protein